MSQGYNLIIDVSKVERKNWEGRCPCRSTQTQSFGLCSHMTGNSSTEAREFKHLMGLLICTEVNFAFCESKK